MSRNMRKCAARLAARIRTHFATGEVWDSASMVEGAVWRCHPDEVEWLHENLQGKKWEDVDIKRLAGNGDFSPTLYCSKEGVLWLLPLTMLAAISDKDIDADCCISAIDSERRRLFGAAWGLSAQQKDVLCDWLRFIRDRDEGTYCLGAGCLLTKLEVEGHVKET